MPELSLLTLNIANPAPERAERQLGWLAARDDDVLVLTETKDSTGCRLLADAFSAAGYHVNYPKPENSDYGVMISSRVQARTEDFGDRVGYLPPGPLRSPCPHPPGRSRSSAPTSPPAMPAPRKPRGRGNGWLLDHDDHVLLIHAKDPDKPDHHWWELPGGGADLGEALPDTARRELAEETGILLDHLGPHLWDRETRFRYRGQEHHRRETVYLARITATTPTLRPRHTANEKAGLLGDPRHECAR